MARRRFGGGDSPVKLGELEKVLDHYGVRYNYRTSQMVSCPLHPDKTPSMSVNLDKQVWNCHSCGAGGGVIHLIMEMEGMDHQRARGFAANINVSTGSDEGGNGFILGGASRRRRGDGVSNRSTSGVVGGNNPYVPAWRRRGPSA